MAEYDNRNTFTLFRNTRKQKDTHPDFNGTFTDEDGNEYYMDAWSKSPKNGGEKFLSGKMKLKAQPAKPAARAAAPAMNDEIPF
jgi:uncharacterized protein (DUF736 family)